MDFDLPSQPLHQALQRYSRQTGRSLLYDSKAVRGRTSSPVRGRHTPQAALRLMIVGTGMTARYTSSDAFVLVPQDAPAAGKDVPVLAERRELAQRRRYYALMQQRVLAALCADRATRPGDYRLALRFRIDAEHAIDQLEIHAQDRPELEAPVRRRLAGLPLGAAPPARLGQPVTLLVLPSAAGPGDGCGGVPGDHGGPPGSRVSSAEHPSGSAGNRSSSPGSLP